jgi:hypothetical protein
MKKGRHLAVPAFATGVASGASATDLPAISARGVQGACGRRGPRRACRRRQQAWQTPACGQQNHRVVHLHHPGARSCHGLRHQNQACGHRPHPHGAAQNPGHHRGHHGQQNRRLHRGRGRHGCHDQQNHHQNHHGHCHHVRDHQSDHATGYHGCRTSGPGRHGRHQNRHRGDG